MPFPATGEHTRTTESLSLPKGARYKAGYSGNCLYPHVEIDLLPSVTGLRCAVNAIEAIDLKSHQTKSFRWRRPDRLTPMTDIRLRLPKRLLYHTDLSESTRTSTAMDRHLTWPSSHDITCSTFFQQATTSIAPSSCLQPLFDERFARPLHHCSSPLGNQSNLKRLECSSKSISVRPSLV